MPDAPVTAKDNNRARLLRLLRRHGPMPRVELGRRTGLSAAAVSSIIAELIGQGVLAEASADPSGTTARGRPPVELAPDPNHGRVAAVSIRMNTVEAIVADYSGRRLAGRSVPCATRSLSGPDVVARCIEAIDAARSEAPGPAPQAIGIAAQGMVDPVAGTQIWSPVLRTGSFDLASPVAAHYGVPVLLENDAAATAIAVAQQEAELQHGLVAVLMVGHGVGMGLLRDGGPFDGPRGASSEVGHVRRQPGGAQCRCGQRGCIEAYIADYALYRDARSLADLPRAEGQQPTEEQMAGLAERARAGDPRLASLFDEAGAALADAVGVVASVLGPRRIAITGSGLRSVDLMRPAFDAALRRTFAPALDAEQQVLWVPGGIEMIVAGMARLALEAVDTEIAAGTAAGARAETPALAV